MPSLAELQTKYPNFKTVIYRKPKLGETQNFGNIITNGYSSIGISFHLEISDKFYFIMWEVLRCPLIAEVQRKVYINKQNKGLFEQNGLLFEAKFNNEVGVTRYKKMHQSCPGMFLNFYIFLNEFQEMYQNCQKRKP